MPDSHSPRRILIVEKSATLRYMLARNIEKLGLEVVGIGQFENAMQRLDDGVAGLQAVLIGWPNYEQFGQSKRLLTLLEKPCYRALPVILLSNNKDEALLDWMGQRCASAFIQWENYREVGFTLQSMLSPAKKRRVEQRREPRESRPVRVLFVDDSKSVRVYYKRLLEANDYVVDVASSVQQAYQIAQTRRIDIAIVDYFMPEEKGVVLCQRLRDNPATADIRTAVITGTYLDEVITDCLQSGAIECMFKNEAEALFLARMAAMRRFIDIQRSIEKQRENLAAILESVGEGVYGVDRQGRLKFMNSEAMRILGIPDMQSVQGLYAADCFHLEQSELKIRDLLKEAYASGSKLKSWETVFRHRQGKSIPVDCTLFPLTVNHRAEGSVVAFRDISDRKLLEEKLRWQATHDHLTGLYNRRYFEEYLEREIERVKRTGIASAVVYFDLDKFKYVNDAAGHETGDHLLVDLSQALAKKMRVNDIAARIGGDEFGLVLRNVDTARAVALAESVRDLVADVHVHFEKRVFRIDASFGVAMIDDALRDKADLSAGDMMVNADIACHISKRSENNRTHVFQRQSDQRNVMGTELGWSTRIGQALENNGFELHFQPILSMQDIDLLDLPAADGQLWRQFLGRQNQRCHYEVLVRMLGEGGLLYYPDSFIPTAERFNLMTRIDFRVVERALQALVAADRCDGQIALSINLSGNTINEPQSLARIQALIRHYSVPPDALTFEITETSAIENFVQANQFIAELQAMGCHFSLDDFGSGFCSFSQLKNLPTRYVKIDGQFVKNMARGATDRAIVTAMNDVAHSLGRHTVAEYVETPETLRLLKICGVDRVQGHYISRPLKKLPTGKVVPIQKKRLLRHRSGQDIS